LCDRLKYAVSPDHAMAEPRSEGVGRPGECARVAADMDGIKALPTSHSIRAYLAVLYRL
jgi:hypothetical protein